MIQEFTSVSVTPGATVLTVTPLVMDVRVQDLRYFIAVTEKLSFTRTANERLFISQPALWKQIGRLESCQRVSLFDGTAGRSR